MIGGGGEKLVELFVLEDSIEEGDLIEGGLSSLISDSCGSDHGEEGEVDFPDEGLVQHQEGEGSVADEAASPAVIGATKVLVDLIQVISGSHSELPEVILEEVVAEAELAWVSLSFVLNNSYKIFPSPLFIQMRLLE